MTPLILKRAPVGDNPDDYSVLENGTVVGRIFKVPVAPSGPPGCGRAGTAASSSAELAQKLGVHARLRGSPRRRGLGASSCRNVPYPQCLLSSRRTASGELPTRATALASSSLLQPSASIR
jgi:hypothetical protein